MKRQRRRSVCVSFNHKTTGITSLPLPRAPCHSDWLEHLNLCLNVAFCCLLERLHVSSLAVSGEVILAVNIAAALHWYPALHCIVCMIILVFIALSSLARNKPELPKSRSWRSCQIGQPPCTAGSGYSLPRPEGVDGKDYLCPSVIVVVVSSMCMTIREFKMKDSKGDQPVLPRQSWQPP